MKKLIVALLSVVGISLASAADSASPAKAPVDGKCPDACCDLLTSYEPIGTALAGDDLAAAKQAAKEFACWPDCLENAKLTEQVKKIENAATIADARAAFKEVNAIVIPLAENAGPHYVMTCPMAKADWIQTKPQLANPYYGKSMLTCGSVKKKVEAKST